MTYYSAGKRGLLKQTDVTTTNIGGVLKVKNEDEKKINNYVLNYAGTFCQHSLTKKNLIVLQIVQKMKYISNVFYKTRTSSLCTSVHLYASLLKSLGDGNSNILHTY